MEVYIFIFKGSTGRYGTAENPIFIPEYSCCRAFKKDEIPFSEDHLCLYLNEIFVENIPESYRDLVNKIKREFSL